MIYQRWRRSLSRLRSRPVTPEDRGRWVVERSDGKIWAGPYRWQGRTFTKHPPLFYPFGTRSAAEAAVLGCGLDDVTVKPIH